MEVSLPLFAIGFKDPEGINEDIVKKHIAIEILLNMIIGKSSESYQELYKEGNLLTEPDLDYEFSGEYAHVVISGQSKDTERVKENIEKTISKYINEGLNEEHFNRLKKKVYGDYVVEYNSVGNIARMFLADSLKKINSFDYIEKFGEVTKEYTHQVLKNVFKKDNMAVSVIKCKPNK